MGAEHSIEDPNEEGYRSLGKMFQGSVRNTYDTWSLVDLETPDGFLNLVMGQKVGPQRHVNHLNNCRDRMVGHRLKLTLQTVSEGFGFLKV